jgi:hypothetical protein
MSRIRSAVVALVLTVTLAAPAQEPAEAPPIAEPGFLENLMRGVQGLFPGQDAPPPTPAEMEEASRVFDAFLTFVVKRAGRESVDLGLRADLLGALLDGRHDTVSLVSGELGVDEAALRELFGATWPRLQPLLQQLVQELGSERGQSYQALIDAGQALMPGVDWDAVQRMALSPDTLRELARIIAPEPDVDPLIYDVEVDPDLRDVFGFGPPLEEPLENPALELEESPPAPPEETPPPLPPPLARSPLRMPILIWAAELPRAIEPAALDELRALARRLNSWVPQRDELDEYLPAVHRMLEASAQHTLETKPVDAQFRPLYATLVLATAWQESCWRQFVRRQGKLQAIASGVGAVGIMQINTRVWRGFYKVEGLHRDAGYNARAGSEILQHYLVDYAIRKGEHTATGDFDNLARATYAIYNGGPRQMRRYRNPGTRRSLRAIDQSFWKKYQEVKGGDPLAVASCYGEGAG